MGAYTCRHGTVHKRCRCPENHSITCPTPTECINKQAADGLKMQMAVMEQLASMPLDEQLNLINNGGCLICSGRHCNGKHEV